jgi:hypothetical protein
MSSQGQKMTDLEIAQLAQDHIVGLMRTLNQEQRRELAAFVLSLGWELTRGLEGNGFMKGWLHAASDDLSKNPPAVVLVEYH